MRLKTIILFFVFICVGAGFPRPGFTDAANAITGGKIPPLRELYQNLQAQIAADPTHLGLKMDLAYVLSQGGETERAIALYREVIKHDSQNVRAVTELCALYTTARDRDAAFSFCTQAVQLSPNDALAHDNLGLFHFKFGAFHEAIPEFVAALRCDPHLILARTHIAQSFLALKKYALAREIFEDLLQNNKTNLAESPLIYYGLALANQGLGQYEAAFESLLKTYHLSRNPLFLGKVVTAYMNWHQPVFFFVFAILILGLASFFGRRLNRFLKNED